jgi:HD-like signal output (HDOD) protein
MTTNVSNEALDRLIRQIDRLHSGPGVAQKILALIRDPEFDMVEVAECLEHDPALSARILGVVNSSRYGLAHKIASIRHAAAFLGRRSLQLVTLSFTLLETFARGPYRQMYLDYWRRALTMATVAHRIAERAGGVSGDEAYAAGLVADLGVLALAQVVGEKYVEMYLKHPHGPELVTAEIQSLGFSHADVGSRLLDRWGLPESVVTAVAGHHDPVLGGEPIELFVRAGWLMSEALWTPNSPHVTAARKFLHEECHLNLDDFIDLALKCRTDIDESAEAFGITMGKAVNCQQLIDEARRVSLETALEAALELDAIETVSGAVPVNDSNRRRV